MCAEKKIGREPKVEIQLGIDAGRLRVVCEGGCLCLTCNIEMVSRTADSGTSYLECPKCHNTKTQ